MTESRTNSPRDFFQTLESQTLEGKRALILGLGHRSSHRSIEILIEVIQGKSTYLRNLAIQAISRIGDPAAPALLEVMRTGLWYARAAAARAMGRIGYAEGLPDLVHLLSDSNHSVQGACLASIADLVRAGQAKETARLFWNQGARRAGELGRLLLAVHPDAGGAVVELLADPSSFLIDEPVRHAGPDTESARDLKNA